MSEFTPKARLVKLDRNDKPPANPFDTAPVTPEDALHEMRVRAALAGMADALRRTLVSITLQQLLEMKKLSPHMEGELPEIDGERHGMFFFSVDGEYQGRKVRRVLLGGEAMLISASGPREARQIAQEGLQETLREGHVYANAVLWDVPLVAENPGIALDAEIPKRK